MSTAAASSSKGPQTPRNKKISGEDAEKLYEAAAKIAADGIDILVDLNGYTKDARTKVFARRPAPIIANWFGFPSTMGTPYHHYIIADESIIPADHEIYYSEKVLRLPCYQPNDRKRTVSARRECLRRRPTMCRSRPAGPR